MSEPGVGVKTLILCIDRDNDIGEKTKIDTPILNRDANFRAASILAIADPEEADSNAMFGAVKLYDRLREEYPNEEYQIATIAGSSIGGIETDRKMVLELEKVLNLFRADGVVLVTDGYPDEAVIPLIQSRVPITSIQHIVVKHSERIEEAYAVLFRYLSMLVKDPYYSKITLGVPGIMLVILGVLTIFGQLQNAGMAFIIVMGLVLLVKGFGWDRKLAMVRLKLPSPRRQLTLAFQGVGIILSIVGCIRGVYSAWQQVPPNSPPWWQNFSYWLNQTPNLLGNFLLKGVDLIILGAMVTLIGGVASYYMQKDPKMWQNVVGMIVTFWLRFIAIESAKVLMEPEKTLTLWSPLVIMTLAGVLTTITSVFFIYGAHKKLPF